MRTRTFLKKTMEKQEKRFQFKKKKKANQFMQTHVVIHSHAFNHV